MASTPAHIAKRRRITLQDAWRWVVIALPPVLLGYFGWRRRWISEDGLVVTRTVRQTLAGNGPVFNMGERVETSTSALWQWLVTWATWVSRFNSEAIAVYGGLLLTAAGVAIALDATTRLYEADRWKVVVPAGVFVLLAMPPVWTYATSGVETGLSTLWMAASWWLLVRNEDESGRLSLHLAGFVFGLGFLVRPELAVVTAVFMLTLWLLRRPRPRFLLTTTLAAAVVPLAYEIFRMGYYGLFVPLPALSREAGRTDVAGGRAYLWDTIQPYWLDIPLLLVAGGYVVVMIRQPAPRLLLLAAPLVSGLIMAGLVVNLGGDTAHARMLLPALFLILLPVLVVPPHPVLVVGAGGMLVVAVLGVTPLRHPFDGEGTATGITNERAAAIDTTGRTHPVFGSDWVLSSPELLSNMNHTRMIGTRDLLVGDPLGDVSTLPLRPDGESRAILQGNRMGVVGAAAPLDVAIADNSGRATALGAHMEADHGAMDHAKTVPPEWTLAEHMDPAAAIPIEEYNPAAVMSARRALGCGEVKEMRDSVSERLSANRFWENLTGAIARTQMRIPRDPFEAEQLFC